MIEVEGLSVHFNEKPVLWDLTFRIPAGTLVAIAGPNGAGKSTLLKAMLGLVRTSCGSVRFLGQPLKAVRTKVAYVPQRDSVDWDFPITGRGVVLMGCYGRLGIFRRPSQKEHAQADQLLSQLNMQSFADQPISSLSGGQKQRLFIARALMQGAEILLMDEPFAGVDKVTEELLIEQLSALRDEGKTILIVHHDLATLKRYFDSCILLNRRLIASGITAQVCTEENIQKTFGAQPKIFDAVTQ